MKISHTFHILLILLVFSTIVYADNIIETKSGLKYEDLLIGEGFKAVPQKIVTIDIVMWTDISGQKGEELYSSRREGVKPMSFVLGTKKIADGLSIGVTGMKVGGKRRLYVPSHLNPQSSSGKYPGNADLIYEVELLDVK